MEKKLIIFSIIIVLITIALCGCDEKEATQTKTFEKINLKSDFQSNVLEITDSNLDINEERGRIKSVTVTLYFKSVINQMMNVTYVVDFCDYKDKVLYSKNYNINKVPANYVFYTPDVFTYAGESVDQFDHININIVEFNIIN